MKNLFIYGGFLFLMSLLGCDKPSSESKENPLVADSLITPPSTQEDSVADNEEMEEVEVASGSNP
jgi:hypothetical protein